MQITKFEYVIKICTSLGYEYISSEYINNKTQFYVKDKEGYIYRTSLQALLKGIVPRIEHMNNDFSINNINLWCKLHNKQFYCISEKYYGNKIKHLFKCYKCGEIFDIRWESLKNQNQGCPFCAGKRISITNCLATINPVLASEWDYDLNDNLTPYDVTCGTNKKVWWKCSENPNHKWFASIASRHRNNKNCPYCCGRLVDPDYNFGTEYPDLAKSWDYSKNKKTPFDYTVKSGIKVWWICDKGHSWKSKICDRVNTNGGCPYCHGRYATFENNFGVVYPNLIKEFDIVKNSKTPYDYTPKSPQKVWWTCSVCGFSWKTSIKIRTLNGCGCPVCSQSHGEKAIYNYLTLNNIQFEYQKEYEGLIGTGGGLLSYDFYIPHLNLLVEYQGQFHDGTVKYQTEERFQNQQEHDKRKRKYTKSHNINLLEIWYWDFDNIEKILSEVLFKI